MSAVGRSGVFDARIIAEAGNTRLLQRDRAHLVGSMDELVQEAGRAGRDGEQADSLVLWCPRDLVLADVAVRTYCEKHTCKRAQILASYEDVDAGAPSGACCDVCSQGAEVSASGPGTEEDADEDDDALYPPAPDAAELERILRVADRLKQFNATIPLTPTAPVEMLTGLTYYPGYLCYCC